jgi:small GTP-binding protein
MDEGELHTSIKVVIVGTAGCGKTRLVQRFAQNIWDETAAYMPTIAIDLQSKILFLNGGKNKARFSFWDTSGHSKFESVVKSYYLHTDVILFAFDASDPQKTLDECLDRFYKREWLEKTNTNPYLALVACKCDLNPDVLRDNPAMMRQIEATGLPMYWTSAREGRTQDILRMAGNHVIELRRAQLREERVMDNLHLIPKPIEQQTICACALL